MPKSNPLPYPQLCTRPADCLRCGYPLEGIPAPGRCPECGLGFDDDLSTLQIAGVPKSAGGPKWRKAVWFLIAVVAFLYAQVIGFIIFVYPWMALLVFAALTAAVVGMAMTNTQKKRGSEYIAFTVTGFSRWPIGSDLSARIYTQWWGADRTVIVKRVSTVWASLKVVVFDESAKRTVLFETGFRCPHEDLQLVEKILNTLILGQPLGEIEGIEQSVLLTPPPS